MSLDTFASKVAAIQDETADASVGNVTGSNAVNVFLGIGIAWSIAAIYHASIGGAFNVGGPPIVAYVYSQGWEKARNVAVLQTVFLAGGFTRNALMGTTGDYTRELFLLLAWAVVPSAIAIALGKKALHLILKQILRTSVFLFVLVLGSKYLLMGR